MSRSSWGVLVATLFAIVTWATPVPERWRYPLLVLAWVAFGLAIIGWLLAHTKTGQRLRSHPAATRPMTLLLIGIVGGLITAAIWYLVPKATQPEPDAFRAEVRSGFITDSGQLTPYMITHPSVYGDTASRFSI